MISNYTCTYLPDQARSLSLQAVIFDMDGSLVATTEADYLAWKKVFADNDRSLSFEEYFPLLGMKSEQVVKMQLGLRDEKALQALARKMEYFEAIAQAEGIQIVPYATAVLDRIRFLKIPLALATSSRKRKMTTVLEQTGLLSYFDVIVTGEEVMNSKPHPDIFLLAADKLAILADKCLVVEDAASGVKAARAAGMQCIAITTTHRSHLLQEADLIISGFDEITFNVSD